MKLPRSTTTQRAPHERKRLAAWLAERELDRLLFAEDDIPAAPGGLRYRRNIVSFQRWRAGDIAILRPDEKGMWGTVYVLLLEQEGGEWRALPFGRYALPAVPGEWQTPFPAAALRVLCLWNARLIDAAELLGGPVKHCPPKLFDRIGILYRAVITGAVVGPRDARRFGPPLVHPADPRYDYLEEERSRLGAHLVARDEAGEDEEGPGSLYSAPGKSEWLLAAEGRPTYGTPSE